MHTSLADKTNAEFFKRLAQAGVAITPEHKASIERAINHITGYVPKVGVFGKTGVGKSSLCNALFGQDVFAISDIQACTRNPQELVLSISDGHGGIKLIDVPGVGENSQRDQEYDELYKRLLPELDLMFWVFKADDRANASDQDFYNRLISPYIQAGKPFLAVLNQVDKIEPFREWNEEQHTPGLRQLQNIKDKCSAVAHFLRLPLNQVIPVSAHEHYGLLELVDAIVHALPHEQKAIVLHTIETAEDIRKKAALEIERAAVKAAEEAAQKLALAQKEAHLNAQAEALKEHEKRIRELQRQAEEAQRQAEIMRRRAQEESERSYISSSSRREAQRSLGSRILDAVERIPVLGSVVGFFRSFF